MRSLSEYSDKAPIFLDSSIFLLHYQGRSEAATKFLEDVEEGKITALTSSVVVSEEVTYICLKLEASKLLSTDKHYEILAKLKDKDIFLQAWSKAEEHLNYVKELELKEHLVVIKETPDIEIINSMAKEYILLPRDALHAATCKLFGVNNIASTNPDFERVDFLMQWTP